MCPGAVDRTQLKHALRTRASAACTQLSSRNTWRASAAEAGSRPCSRAMRAIASTISPLLRLQVSLSQLIALARSDETRSDATVALAVMPDPRALDVYLAALDDRNPDIRRVGQSALLRIRGQNRFYKILLAARQTECFAVAPFLFYGGGRADTDNCDVR